MTVMLAFAAIVGAVGGYLREYAQRDKFLLRRVLHHLAMIDPLTGVANRRQFEQQASAAIAQARRDGQSVTLAILDVDHFKRFNDRYGHLSGDNALKKVAQCLSGFARRPLDVVGRLGGEEFGILLHGAARDRLEAFLEEIIGGVSSLRIPHGHTGTERHVTASLGAAILHGRESLEDLYERADCALYEAKKAGRNRVRIDRANVIGLKASR